MPAKQLMLPEHLRADPVTGSFPGSRFYWPWLREVSCCPFPFPSQSERIKLPD